MTESETSSAPSDSREMLRRIVTEEARLAVHPAAAAMAEAVAARHPAAALGVIFYGSCLRDDSVLRGEADGVLDFYLVVDSYRTAYASPLQRTANRLLPPNVFYLERDVSVEDTTRTLRCKYAVVSLAQLRRGTSRRSFNPSLWARFAQPVRLLAARDAQSERAICTCLAEAVVTLLAESAPLAEEPSAPEALFVRAFEETYRCELRSEGRNRARALVGNNAERYAELARPGLRAAGIVFREDGGKLSLPTADKGLAWRWRLRRVQGKALSVLRLLKAAFTFEGGADYLMWKIERHSGVSVPLSDWQRRHALLAAPLLAFRLYRRGAFR